MTDLVRPHGQQPTRLLCPWDSPGKNTGVGCHFLLRKLSLGETKVRQGRVLWGRKEERGSGQGKPPVLERERMQRSAKAETAKGSLRSIRVDWQAPGRALVIKKEDQIQLVMFLLNTKYKQASHLCEPLT